MPWTVADVEKHNKGLSSAKKAQWVAVANSVLAKCMKDGGKESECAASAIRQANGVVANESAPEFRNYSQEITVDRLSMREEMHQGRKHIVVPVIMMVEGVHNGSHGPIYHSSEELGRFPAAWNGIPVTIGHPEVEGANVSANQPGIIDGNMVGRVYNTHMDGDKLRAEAWIDLERISQVSPQALSYIREGRPIDVSVGVFSDEDQSAGTWNDEEYVAIARNHRPDHLALLPGGVGACSWADGCGVRVNQEGGDDALAQEVDDLKEISTADINDLPDSAFAYIESGGSKDKGGKTVPRSLRHFPVHDAAHARNALARMSQSPFGQKAKKKIMAACKKFGIEVAGQNNQESGPNEELTAMVGALVAHGCTIHMMSTPQMGTNSQESADLGYRETMSKVQALLNTMDTGDKLHFLQEVYDDQVIYEVATRGTGQSSYYTQEYEVDDNGDVNLVGVPTKVIRRVSFVTANSETNSDGGINTMAETTVKKPCCPGKVELLIQSELSPFEEIDREWLSGLEEGQIDRLVQTDVALSEATKKAEEKPPQVNREQAISVLKEDLSDREKFVTLLPEALQEEVRSGLNLHRERRQKMIQALVEAFPKKFTEDKLKNRTTEALEELIGMIPEKPADFSANGAGSESINANMGMAADDILLPIGVEIK